MILHLVAALKARQLETAKAATAQDGGSANT